MKIAMTLSGQARFVKEGNRFLKQSLINFKDMDVFIHTWKDHEYKDVIKTYGPKECIIEKQEEGEELKYVNDPEGAVNHIDYTQADGGSGNWAHYCMFYSMQQSYKLIPPGYDIIIRTRFDTALVSKIDITSGVVKSNKVYAPDVCKNASVISDWMFWGRPNAMGKILNTYDSMPQMQIDGINMQSGEELINSTLKNKNIKREKLPIDLKLIRSNDAILMSDQWVWSEMLEKYYEKEE